jgi:DNA polymerase-3 subunit beta
MGPGVPVTIAFGQPAGAQDRAADGMIGFEGGGRRLTARLLGAEFIRYESRFPAEFGCSAELPAGPFTDAVRRVALVADRTSPVQLSFRSDAVVIEARSDGRARAVETVPVTFRGEQQAIAFNPHYLLDGLAAAALSSQETEPADSAAASRGFVRLDFTSPAKPALITWAGSEESPKAEPGSEAGASAAFRYLVVPLRGPAGG